MKLLNRATVYFAGLLLGVISVWAVLFYLNLLNEIYDSMDDGLENQKLLVMQRAAQDSTVLAKTSFADGYYTVKEVSFSRAIVQRDVYQDTLMYMQNEEDFEPVRMLTSVFQHQQKYYELRVITSMVEEDDLVEELLLSLLWLYLGLITTLLLLNNILLKKIWRPFYHLLDGLQKFRLENPTPFPTQPTSIEEFNLLNQAVEKLLQRNLDTYASQKAFIENASHELQTPLAISLNKLELLAESAPLQEEQLVQIGSIMENLERLTRLNKALLLLTKIENHQFVTEEKVDISHLLQQILDDFKSQLAFKKITLTLQIDEAVSKNMNPDLAAMLLLNLVKNALVHNHPDGTIFISLTPTQLQLENTGSEIPLNPEKLFLRFYKGDNSAASTGLGLSIVQAICDTYGFTISYSFNQRHTLLITF